jgi:two-component system sensor histidine kinase KdpD
VLREVKGILETAAAIPSGVQFGPIDQAALDWAWAQGEEAGSGTEVLSSADWQFQPLKTSLGALAVLGISREDGRDPVRADQRLLLQTLVAQSALAHERLRLEDMMREPATAAPAIG